AAAPPARKIGERTAKAGIHRMRLAIQANLRCSIKRSVIPTEVEAATQPTQSARPGFSISSFLREKLEMSRVRAGLAWLLDMTLTRAREAAAPPAQKIGDGSDKARVHEV